MTPLVRSLQIIGGVRQTDRDFVNETSHRLKNGRYVGAQDEKGKEEIFSRDADGLPLVLKYTMTVRCNHIRSGLPLLTRLQTGSR